MVAVSPAYAPARAWVVTFMLAVLLALNFLDKVLVDMLAVPIMAEFGLTPVQYGVIAGSFFWLFSLSALLIGFLSNRLKTRWLLFGMALMWSVVQLPLAFRTTAPVLLVCRVLLGAGEGPAFGVMAHGLCKWFPDERRSLPIAVVNQSAFVGLLIAGFMVPQVSQLWGWKASFLLLAAAGMVWAMLWLIVGREGPLQPPQSARVPAQRKQIPYVRLFSDPTIWCGYVNAFAVLWTLTLTLTWLPTYMTKGLGFNAVTSGRIFALIVGVGVPTGIFLNWVSQRMMIRGVSSRIARPVLISVCVFVAGIALLSLQLPGLASWAKVLMLAIACTLSPMCNAIGPAIFARCGRADHSVCRCRLIYPAAVC